MKKNPTYIEALAEIEEIIGRLGRQPCDVDTLAAQVARAEKLIAHCRERLLAAESELDDAEE
jgi:exodeoxyribonuclease VII small subunit